MKSPNPWSGRPPWNRSWKSCLAAGKRWRRSSQAVPCRAPGKRSNRWSTYFQDTTLVLFLRGRYALPHLGKTALYRPTRHVRGEFLCTEGSHNGREPHATSRMTFHRETRHHSYPQTAWENPSL